MSAPTFVILIACFASIALADDFKTTDGKEYKNVTVSRVEPDGIVISFSGGIVKIPFIELSEELQRKYNYDPETAKQFAADIAQKQQELYTQTQSQKEEANARASEIAAKSAAPERQPVSASLHESALDRKVGPKPEQLPDGTVVSLDKQIRPWLLDPDSLIYDSWGELKVGLSPGGNPAWTVTVTYRTKNAHGAYMGNMTCSYWLREKDGVWLLRPSQ
jgi:hypothetical protein